MNLKLIFGLIILGLFIGFFIWLEIWAHIPYTKYKKFKKQYIPIEEDKKTIEDWFPESKIHWELWGHYIVMPQSEWDAFQEWLKK
jgi:hypothetical protein